VRVKALPLRDEVIADVPGRMKGAVKSVKSIKEEKQRIERENVESQHFKRGGGDTWLTRGLDDEQLIFRILHEVALRPSTFNCHVGPRL
jgi:hypothetical protein